MNTFTNLYCWLQARAAQDRGAGLAEYALLLFLIALASLAILTDLGTWTKASAPDNAEIQTLGDALLAGGAKLTGV